MLDYNNWNNDERNQLAVGLAKSENSLQRLYKPGTKVKSIKK